MAAMTQEISSKREAAIEQLLAIMRRLRDPEGGCPWDLRQDFDTIVPYTLEEAYEVADAIERGAYGELQAELGDLLFQVVFYARLAEERGLFDFRDVVEAICDKLVRRHPHVFGDAEAGDEREQARAWEAHKRAEREARTGAPTGLLHDIPAVLPALSRAFKLQRRAARAGLDWGDVEGVLEKLDEELAELRAARAGAVDERAVREEMGDLLFTCVNLARHLDIDPEQALREANRKFERRVAHIERALGEQGIGFEEADEALLDRLWESAKRAGS